MNCATCNLKECKTKGKDCTGEGSVHLEQYLEENNLSIYKTADYLVIDGRGGKLSRLEEIILFCKKSSYKKIGIAYCHSVEKLAAKFMFILRKEGFQTTTVRCTIGGITENQIMKNSMHNVNCNPISQAKMLNKMKVDFVIEMGLCLGHDVIFHKYIEAPFTVFIVKDRVFGHNPGKALDGHEESSI